MNKKRVIMLLRDSTLKQDISMQRIACTQFAELHPDWEIIDEITEEGVSGFKKTAQQRDGLQQAKTRALNGEYEVLLVYMFDRIGRLEEESPFIVKWFVMNGIEVWSTKEGQQTFENHTDNLVNFLRFWQAEGESVKISARTKTKFDQMAIQGRYLGGSVPLGYRIEKQGRINPKGHEVHEIVVDKERAGLVRLIFEKCAYEGFGTRRIAKYLNEQGIRKKDGGAAWVNTSIQRILRNIAYLGIIKSGETTSDIFPHLQIVDIELFDRVQKVMDERKTAYVKTSSVPLSTKGKSLMSGKLYCASCGCKMVQTTHTKKRTLADGTVKGYERRLYRCYGRSRFIECSGAETYTVSIADDIVDKTVIGLLQSVQAVPFEVLAQEQYDSDEKIYISKKKDLTHQHKKKVNELDKLEAELINVIIGESILDRDTLNRVLEKTKAEVIQIESELAECDKALSNETELRKAHSKQYDRLITWADIYSSSSQETRKMIIAEMFDKIEINRGYEMKFSLSVAYQDLYDTLQMNKEEVLKPA